MRSRPLPLPSGSWTRALPVPPTATAPVTRSASRPVACSGGYIAGGVLTEADAKAGIAAAVERNTDKLSRAWRVIARGLQYGEAAPITLADLEVEWEQWKKAHPLLPGTAQAISDRTREVASTAVAYHVLPAHIQNHPDPRVRRHWERIYRQTNDLKRARAAQGARP